ncbi:hypothetical protein LguiB_029970 [Lonicera macranthoides]
MASSSSNNNPDGFSYIDEINLCLAWKQVTRDGTWCERDNPKTWERMATIFNAEPKTKSSLWNDRVVTPKQLAQLWVKVELAVTKWNRFYNEKERPTPYPKFLINYPGSRAHYLVKFSNEVEKKMFWFEVFGEDWRVVASGQSSLHPLTSPIDKHVLLIAKFNLKKSAMDNGSHELTHFEWVTNTDGSLHGHDPEDLLNNVCQTFIWKAESLNTGIAYNTEEMATTPDTQMQMEID